MREQEAGRRGVRRGPGDHDVAQRRRGCRKPAVITAMHPARVVARAGTHGRTSAHKGSPLFRRWAPAANTLDRDGSPDSTERCGQATRRRPSRKQDQGYLEDVRREHLHTRAACAHLTEGRWLGGMRVSRRDGKSGHGEACSRYGVLLWTFQRAGCPCNRDNACRTRMHRADWYAGASRCRTPGRVAMAVA